MSINYLVIVLMVTYFLCSLLIAFSLSNRAYDSQQT